MSITKTSDSEKVYKYLVHNVALEQTFTSRELHTTLTEQGIIVTFSALTAFLTRAYRNTMVGIVNKEVKGPNKYILQHKREWKFGHKTVGSKPGRTLVRGEIEVIKHESFSSKLIDIAACIEQLENKREKTLADYTTDELMSELKRRLK